MNLQIFVKDCLFNNMKIAIVHNDYGKHSGEETVIENLAALLVERGVSVCRFSRSSAVLEDNLPGKMAAFFRVFIIRMPRKRLVNFCKAIALMLCTFIICIR